jgi:hypothetical protein
MAGEAVLVGKLPDEGAVGGRGRPAQAVVEIEDYGGDAALAAEGQEQVEQGDGVGPAAGRPGWRG